MDLEEIRSKCETEEIDVLKELISIEMLKVDYGSMFWKNQTYAGLYRARKHNDILGRVDKDGQLHKFINEKEYWNPPPESIKYLGRCNDINESMFYSSNEFETAIAEVRPQKGDFVSVATFGWHSTLSVKAFLPSLKINPIGVQYLAQIPNFKKHLKDFDLNSRGQKFLEVDNFLDSLFCEIVPAKENYKYKLSIAVTKCLLADITNGRDTFSMNGIIYPSIIRDFSSINILLKPYVAINTLYIRAVQTFEVIDENNDGLVLRIKRHGYLEKVKEHAADKFDIVWQELDDNIQETTSVNIV